NTEADTQGCLPQWKIRRANQCEKNRGYEKAFVNFVTAHHGEHHFPETTYDKYCGIYRKEVGCTQYEVIPDAVWVVTGKPAHQNAVPIIKTGCTGSGQDSVSLKADVVHPEEHGRECTQPNGNHYALQVNAITHMGR